MTIDRINIKKGQVPTESDWETWLNAVIDLLNAGLSLDYLAKDGAGKLVISITGDAGTLNGKTAAEIVAGDFPEITKTLIDVITGTSGKLVLTGGAATKNAVTANQLDVTAVKVLQRITATGYADRVELAAASKTVTLPNATYYLDVAPGAADYSWGTAHPAGDYVPLASVNTDASANIALVNDERPLAAALLHGYDCSISAEDFYAGVLDQTSAPAGNTTAATGLKAALSWIVNRLKAISGETNWWDAIGTTLKSLVTTVTNHMGNKSNPHEVTLAQVGGAASSHVGSGGNAHADVVAGGAAGFMTGADKAKLDGIEAEATADMTAAEILTAIKTVDGDGSGLDACKIHNLEYNQLAHEIFRDASGVIQYESSEYVANDTEAILSAYGGTYYDLDKNIVINCDNVNFVKIDYEVYWDLIGSSSSAKNIKARLKDDATGLYYAETSEVSLAEITYGWITGYADLSDLSGNVTFSIELYVSLSSPAMELRNRGLDVHANKVRTVRWS